VTGSTATPAIGTQSLGCRAATAGTTTVARVPARGCWGRFCRISLLVPVRVQSRWKSLATRRTCHPRVSTIDQTTANQERELREVADRAGWQITQVYKDHGTSGAKGRDKRPQFDRLLKDASSRQFDVVMAWSVDRLGRSLQDLISFLGELHSLKIDLFLKQQGLDTTTPAGRAMFQMLGVFAEFERSIIHERVCAGLRRTKDEGKQLGRPRLAPSLEQRILGLLKAGTSIRKVAEECGVNPSTVQRVKHPFAEPVEL
jgi:DNA invertase Pin-like site-specific DNA recombinase